MSAVLSRRRPPCASRAVAAHCAVSQAVLLCSSAASVIAVAGRAGAVLDLVPPAICPQSARRERSRAPPQGIRAGRLPLWRLLTANLIFTSASARRCSARRHVTPRSRLALARGTAEFLFGYGLLLSFRLIERRRGSTKFAVRGAERGRARRGTRKHSYASPRASASRPAAQTFALTSVGVATLLQLAAAAALARAGVAGLGGGGGGAGLASGPYGLLFALLALYITDVPVTARFSLAGLPLTDRAFTLAPAAHLAACHGLRSAVPAAAGFLAGLAVSRDFAGLARRTGPLVARVVELAAAAAAAASCARARAGGTAKDRAASQPAAGARPAAADAAVAAHARAARPQTSSAAAAQPAAISSEAVEALTVMGFSAAAAQQALAVAGGNVEQAANLLLSGFD